MLEHPRPRILGMPHVIEAFRNAGSAEKLREQFLCRVCVIERRQHGNGRAFGNGGGRGRAFGNGGGRGFANGYRAGFANW